MKSRLDMAQAQVAQTSHFLMTHTNISCMVLRELAERCRIDTMMVPKLVDKKVLHL